MVWRDMATNHYSNQRVPGLFTHIHVTHPRWVKTGVLNFKCVPFQGHYDSWFYNHHVSILAYRQQIMTDVPNYWLCIKTFVPLVPKPLHVEGLTLIPAWINNHLRYTVWDEITYPFPNFNGCNRWSLGMDKEFHPTLYNGYNYLMHVSKGVAGNLDYIIAHCI